MTVFALVVYYSMRVSVPEYVITEFSWYVVLDSLPFKSLLYCMYLSGAEGEAATEHVEQSSLYMKALILAPVREQHHH